MARDIKCSDCGEVLFKEDGICPACGSINCTVSIIASERLNIGLYEQIEGKVKEEGKKRPVREFVYGDERRKSNDTWVEKTRIIDRENNKYLEIVKDKKTDEVIHECKESLTDHFGHGTAKKK